MREVKVFKIEREFNKDTQRMDSKKVYQCDGIFQKWGADYIDYGDGSDNFTVAIVELKDGTVIMPAPDFIQFKEPLDKDK